MKKVTKTVNRTTAKRMEAKAKAAGVRMAWTYDIQTGKYTVIFVA